MKTLCGQLDLLTIAAYRTLCRIFHQNRTSKTIFQKVVPHVLRNQITDEMHKELNGGHIGIRRAKSKLQQRFYWPKWGTSVQLSRQRRQQCACYQKPRPHHQGQLCPMVTGEPWERLGIDVTGPHPTSAKGNCYILTVIDHFTKWVEILPCKPRKPVWSQNYWSTDLCVHGCPKQILTDQGPNFESQLFQELCRLLAVDKSVLLPINHPRMETSKGFIPRWTRSL